MRCKRRLLGKNRDPAVPLHGIRVEKGIPVVDAARAADRARPVQNCLRKCRLARVNVGKEAYTQILCFFLISSHIFNFSDIKSLLVMILKL